MGLHLSQHIHRGMRPCLDHTGTWDGQDELDSKPDALHLSPDAHQPSLCPFQIHLEKPCLGLGASACSSLF